MSITVCGNEIHYEITPDCHLFDSRDLIKLIWKNHSYYYNKWLKTENTTLQDIGETNRYCTLDDLVNFWTLHPPADKSKASTYDEFYQRGLSELRELVNRVPLEETVLKSVYEDLELVNNGLNTEIESLNTSLNRSKAKLDKIAEESKSKFNLRKMLVNPDLPLWSQLTVTIVLTFFTWTVFAHYFNFGTFSEYTLFHGGITLLAAISFEFGMLIFTVRRDTFWLNVTLLFQFIILGIHSGLLSFEYESVEDFLIKFVLTSLLPIINKAFSATNFKK